MRVEVARQREVKWLDMFRHWDKWIKHRFQKVMTNTEPFIRIGFTLIWLGRAAPRRVVAKAAVLFCLCR